MIGKPLTAREPWLTEAVPTGVRVIDLESPEQALPVVLDDGRPCRWLIGLVRAGERPLASVDLPLDEHGRATAADLTAALDGVDGGEGARPARKTRPGDPTITVIVTTCSQPTQVTRCVRSLLATGYGSLEVVVVENRPEGSRLRESLTEHFPGDGRIRVVDAPTPGLSRARNAGLEAASGEIVAFVDDDVTVDPAWVRALADAFTDPEVACVTGLILPMALETVEQLQFEQLAGFGKGLLPRSYVLGDRTQHGPLFPYAAGAFGSGSNTALRTSVARQLRGFDQGLGTGTAARGGEDLDLYIRLLQAGHRLDYEPAAIVFHQHPSGAQALRDRAFSYGIGLTAMLTRRLLTGGSGRDLLAAVPAGVRYLLNPDSRKNALRTAAYPRRLVWLERLGMAAGPVALMLSLRSGDRDAGPEFHPGATGVVDLDVEVGDLDLGTTADGKPYGSFLALVRLHGDPLAAIEVPLTEGRIAGDALADHLWRECRPQIEAHARRATTAAASPRPFVSVVVPTAGRPQRIRTCLESLRALNYPAFEIVIVDNAPHDPRTREAVQAFDGAGVPVRYVAEPLPGSSVARNRGAREARGDLIAFTDDDVTVDPDWLTWMISPFLEDPATGVVTGLVMPARLDTPEQRRFEELSGFGKGFERRVYDLEANFATDRLLYPYWGAVFGSGNSMAFRRHVYEDLGGLDPALGAGSPARAGADIESFSHAIIRGQRLVYEPRAVCWHDHRATEAGLRRQTFNYGVGCTAILTKWWLRDRRLRAMSAREGLALLRRWRHGARRTTTAPHELARFKTQMEIHRRSGMLVRQFAGLAMGPAMYARSLLWTRRRRLRSVLPASGEARG